MNDLFANLAIMRLIVKSWIIVSLHLAILSASLVLKEILMREDARLVRWVQGNAPFESEIKNCITGYF
jgi:hypothetical protein